METKITLNLQNFEPSKPAEVQSSIENDQEALAEATKELFEKIAKASTQTQDPTPPTQETTKEIFEKIAKASESVSLASTTQEALEKAKLAKLEQKRLENEKRKQEALAKEKAKEAEKARLEKLEQIRINALAIAAAKEKARLAAIEQKRLQKEKKKQEALAKMRQKKQAKRKKEKLAKAKAQKKKRLKQKLAKIKKQKSTKRHSKDPLANAIMSSSTSVRPSKSRRPAMRMIKQFYGSEFNAFTPTQKKFIEKNLGSIYQITQRTLTRNGYPSVAARTHQQGTQIVTFYLHPNGAISGLRLKKRVGYASLDKNTIRVIRIAYKDYPRPKTKTKITFYVEYSLF